MSDFSVGNLLKVKSKVSVVSTHKHYHGGTLARSVEPEDVLIYLSEDAKDSQACVLMHQQHGYISLPKIVLEAA